MKSVLFLLVISLIFADNVYSDAHTKSAEYLEIENYVNGNEGEIPSPSELERKYCTASESKKDECFKIYASVLKHKNAKCEKERKDLHEIFQNLNRFFSLLADGGIGFGHESERICAYVEYELFHLQKNRLDEKMVLSDSAKDDFESTLWTTGTQNVNMQQNMFLIFCQRANLQIRELTKMRFCSEAKNRNAINEFSVKTRI